MLPLLNEGRPRRFPGVAVSALLAALPLFAIMPNAALADTTDEYMAELNALSPENWLVQNFQLQRHFPVLAHSRRLAAKGHGDEAMRQLGSYLASDPSDLDIRFEYLVLATTLKQYAAAIGAAGRILAAVPDFSPARFYRGVALAALGRNRQALPDLAAAAADSNALSIANADYARRLLGQAALAIPATSETLAILDQAAAGPAKGPVVLMAKGQLLERLGRPAEAISAYDAAANGPGNPADRRAASLLGAELALKRGDLSAALSRAQSAWNFTPGNRNAGEVLADAASRLGRADLVLSAEHAMVKAGTMDRATQEACANALFRVHRYDLATRRFDALAKTATGPAEEYRLRRAAGFAALAGRDGDHALAEFQRAAAINPDSQSLSAVVEAALQAGHRDLAATELKRLANDSDGPERMRALVRLSVVEEQSGDFRAALAALEQITAAQRNTGVERRSAVLAGKAGDRRAAVGYARLLAQSEPTRENLQLLGETELAAGQPDAAVQSFEKALGFGHRDDPALREAMANALLAAGHPARAAAAFDTLAATATGTVEEYRLRMAAGFAALKAGERRPGPVASVTLSAQNSSAAITHMSSVIPNLIDKRAVRPIDGQAGIAGDPSPAAGHPAARAAAAFGAPTTTAKGTTEESRPRMAAGFAAPKAGERRPGPVAPVTFSGQGSSAAIIYISSVIHSLIGKYAGRPVDRQSGEAGDPPPAAGHPAAGAAAAFGAPTTMAKGMAEASRLRMAAGFAAPKAGARASAPIAPVTLSDQSSSSAIIHISGVIHSLIGKHAGRPVAGQSGKAGDRLPAAGYPARAAAVFHAPATTAKGTAEASRPRMTTGVAAPKAGARAPAPIAPVTLRNQSFSSAIIHISSVIHSLIGKHTGRPVAGQSGKAGDRPPAAGHPARAAAAFDAPATTAKGTAETSRLRMAAGCAAPKTGERRPEPVAPVTLSGQSFSAATMRLSNVIHRLVGKHTDHLDDGQDGKADDGPRALALALANFRRAVEIDATPQALNAAVETARKAGLLAEAIGYLEQLAHIDPTRANLRTLGEAELAAGQPDAAMRSFKRALDLGQKDDPALREMMANTLMAAGQPARAADEFARMAATAQGTVDRYRLWLAAAFAALKAGEQMRALASFQRAAAVDPTRQALTAAAETSIVSGRFAQAAAYFERLTADRDPIVRAHAWERLSVVYEKMGRTRPALQALLKLPREARDAPAALRRQAVLAQKLGDRKLLLASLQALAAAEPSTKNLAALADAEIAAGQLGAAAAGLNALLDHRNLPAAARALYMEHLGNVEAALHDPGRAEALFVEAYQLSPARPPRLLAQAAASAMEARDWDQAVQIYRMLVANHRISERSRANYNISMGNVLASLSHHEEALAAYDEAVRLGGATPQLRMSRGAMLLSLHQAKAAASDFRAAYDARPDADSALSLGYAHQAAGQPGLAIVFLRRALAAPAPLTAAQRQQADAALGYAYSETEQYQSAAEYFERALAAWPHPTSDRR